MLHSPFRTQRGDPCFIAIQCPISSGLLTYIYLIKLWRVDLNKGTEPGLEGTQAHVHMELKEDIISLLPIIIMYSLSGPRLPPEPDQPSRPSGSQP